MGSELFWQRPFFFCRFFCDYLFVGPIFYQTYTYTCFDKSPKSIITFISSLSSTVLYGRSKKLCKFHNLGRYSNSLHYNNEEMKTTRSVRTFLPRYCFKRSRDVFIALSSLHSIDSFVFFSCFRVTQRCSAFYEIISKFVLFSQLQPLTVASQVSSQWNFP